MWVLVAVVVVVGGSCGGGEPEPDSDNPNVSEGNFTPPTVIAHGACAETGDTTQCQFAHEGCAAGDRQEVCQKGKSLAFPDCAPTAEVAGTASASQDADAGGDGDFVFDITPSWQAAILDPTATPPRLVPRELRDAESFALEAGHMHIEVQSCRFCRGQWIFAEAPGVVVDGEIHDGDLVAASGNWVADLPQHAGWSEIHEATAIGVVKPVTDDTSYILVNAFFVDSPDQRDALVLDVPVPPPPPATASVMSLPLACDVDVAPLQRGCPCATATGVTVTATADAAAGQCHVKIVRGAGAPAPLPFSCVNTPPCHGGPFTPSPATCANIFFGGVVRARWR